MAPVTYRCDPNLYNKYYTQTGSGGMEVFAGLPYQNGYGIGSMLGALFRTIIPAIGRTVAPLVKSGAKAIGRSVIRTGGRVLKDVISKRQGIKNSLRTHAKQELEHLTGRALNKIAKSVTEKRAGHSGAHRKQIAASRKRKKKASRLANKKHRPGDIFD